MNYILFILYVFLLFIFYIIYILYIVYDILDIMYQILYIILSYSYKKSLWICLKIIDPPAIAWRQEYQHQRYEGGFTTYGPYTHAVR